MHYKIKNRTLLNAEIVSPDIPYAEFSTDLTKESVEKIVAALNFGCQAAGVYGKYRNHTTLQSTVDMLEELERAYKEYSIATFNARRNDQ
jgi:hypothetical protein